MKGSVRQKAHCPSDGQLHWMGKAIVMSELLKALPHLHHQGSFHTWLQAEAEGEQY